MQTQLKNSVDSPVEHQNLLNKLAEQQAVIEQQKQQIAHYEKLVKLYEEAERLAKLQKFASRSEKSKFQFDVFDEAELEQALSDLEGQIETEEAEQEQQNKKKKPHKNREGFSPDLPRVRVDLPLSDEEKAGATNTNTFFTKVKEELDIIPAQAQIIEYWQEKAVFGDEIGENTIVSAKRPVHPLGKSVASIALLAYVIVSKYADALPLYRLESILKRYGGSISRYHHGQLDYPPG
jgi:transposase